MFGRSLLAIRSFMMEINSSSGDFAHANRKVQPSLDARAHEILGVREVTLWAPTGNCACAPRR